MRAKVEDALCYPTGKVSHMPTDHKWLVLGYRRSSATTAPKVVLYEATTDDNSIPDAACVWAMQGLRKVLEGCTDAFEGGQIREDSRLASSRQQNALTAGDRDRPSQSIPVEGWLQNLLEPNPGCCCPRPPTPGRPPSSSRNRGGAPSAAEAEQGTQKQSRLLKAPAPNPKNTKKALNLPSGEYLCRRYASTTFRGVPRALLFLVPAGEDGEPATDEETPIRALPRGGDHSDWHYRGAAKGICPPALLPGRRADNVIYMKNGGSAVKMYNNTPQAPRLIFFVKKK